MPHPALVRTISAIGLVVLVAASCSSDDGPEPTTTSPGESVSTTTPPASHAEVDIDGAIWTFDVNCAETGDDTYRVWGPGRPPDRDDPAQLLVEASVPDPYVAVTAAGTIYEASFTSPSRLVVTGDVLTISDIEWSADTDLTTGEGTPSGAGSVTITCLDYVDSPPD